MIRTRQNEYYDVLGKSDRNGDSSEFVQMMLSVIHDTLKDYEDNTDQVTDQENDQVKIDNPNLIKLLGVIGDDTLSAAEIMSRIGLTHKPTFRKII